MREARIIFAGEHTAWMDGVNALLKSFDGSTVYIGWGNWRDQDGKLLTESIRIADIAYDQNTKNDLRLYDIADAYRNAADQQAVYLRYGNGHVQMVTAKSCMDNGEFDWEALRKEIREPADDIGDIVPDTSHLVTI